jgi:hypothetical protein
MCARVMAHLFSDIRNLEWQTLYPDMTLIAQPRKNTSNHASHTRYGPPAGSRRHGEDAQDLKFHSKMGLTVCDRYIHPQ